MIDVLNACLRCTHQRDRVVNCVNPHQRNIADAVADAGITDLGPEPLVADGIDGVEADMAEPGDAGVARGEIAAAAALGAHHELDMISAGIVKGDEGPHLSPAGVVGGAGLHAVAKPPANFGMRPFIVPSRSVGRIRFGLKRVSLSDLHRSTFPFRRSRSGKRLFDSAQGSEVTRRSALS